jgi:hypothetical protein
MILGLFSVGLHEEELGFSKSSAKEILSLLSLVGLAFDDEPLSLSMRLSCLPFSHSILGYRVTC